jgi:hypothetical protein
MSKSVGEKKHNPKLLNVNIGASTQTAGIIAGSNRIH